MSLPQQDDCFLCYKDILLPVHGGPCITCAMYVRVQRTSLQAACNLTTTAYVMPANGHTAITKNIASASFCQKQLRGMQGKCPKKKVPAASAAEKRLCTSDFAEAQLGLGGTFFDACVKAAANTQCKDTVLARAGGSRIIPDWCIDHSSDRTVATFSCPGRVSSAPKYVYCAESNRTAECGNTFCLGGPPVRADTAACCKSTSSELVLHCRHSLGQPRSAGPVAGTAEL